MYPSKMASLKALVEAQGGRLWLESEMGVGSTFSLILLVATSSNEEGKGVSGEDSPARST